ncbi:uncharacterized protein LOC120426930 [Culex pipiens pallens]|uniref:uncharacterized protein LOC120426930 n=1 Tax=Culex pipiens pallens TaxID=42434 RepID=UPI0019544BC6|nr:uncharacterized protein LOC120426930 [Culex pipiens pallens]
MLNVKGFLLLLGALMLISSFCDAQVAGQLSPEDKRRIVKSMLQSQKDIRKALLKIRAQIQSGGVDNGPPNGGDDDDDEDEDDDDWVGGDDGLGGPENEEYYREQQLQIKAARERLEIYVKNIASKFIEIHDLIVKMNDKVDEQLLIAHSQVNYNLHYNPHRPKPTRPTRPTRPTINPTGTTPPPPEHGYYRSYQENPFRYKRGSRSLEGTIPTTVDTEQLASPDVPSVAAYDDPTQKVVQYQLNQQQVQT